MLHNTNVAAPCLTTPRRGRRGPAPRSKPATRQRRERRRGRSPRLRKVTKRAAPRPTRAGAAVEARDRARQHRERETRSAWMPSGQGPGRRGRHEDTAAVEDDGCRGTTPAARDEAVAASTEAKAEPSATVWWRARVGRREEEISSSSDATKEEGEEISSFSFSSITVDNIENRI